MRVFVLIFIIFLSNVAICAEVGRYNYSNSLLLQQQLRNNQINRARRQAVYNYYSNPVRNIRYPSSSVNYPNIERTTNSYIPARQRYSREYYQGL